MQLMAADPFVTYLAHVLSELRGSWFSQPLIAHALEHVIWMTTHYLGFAHGQVRQHCTFHYAAPPRNVTTSGYYNAGKLVCRFRQYVTAP